MDLSPENSTLGKRSLSGTEEKKSTAPQDSTRTYDKITKRERGRREEESQKNLKLYALGN